MNDFNNKITTFAKSVSKGLHTDIAKDYERLNSLDISSLKTTNFEELKTITEICNKKRNIQVFLVIMLKGYTWNRELQNSFNIANYKLGDVIELLQDKGLIIARDYYTIDEVYQEMIFKLSPDFKHWIVNNPQIYILSDKGKLLSTKIMSYLQDSIKENVNLVHTFDFIQQKTAAARNIFNKIIVEEQTLLFRKTRSPFENIEFEKETILLKEIKEEVKSLPISEKFKYIPKQKEQIQIEETIEERIGKTELEIDEEVEKRQNDILKILKIEE